MRRPPTSATAISLSCLLLIVGCGARHALVAADGAPDAGDAAGSAETGADTAGGETTSAVPPETFDAGESLPDCGSNADGGAWQVLGGPLASENHEAFAPALALGEGDQPVVAWYEGKKVFTSAWTDTGCGGQWRDLGAPVDGGYPALVSDSRGLIRAYVQLEGSQVIVERWNGSAFVTVGAPLDATQPLIRAFAPSVITDPDGNPIVAWDVDALHPNVQAARWTGTEWRALTDMQGVAGGIVSSDTYDFTPVSLALAPDGSLFAAWCGGGQMTKVARYASGTTWTDLGLPLARCDAGLEYGGPLVRVSAAGDVFVASLTPLQGLNAGDGVVFHQENGGWAPVGAGAWMGGLEFDLVLNDAAAPLLVSVEPPSYDNGHTIFMYRWTGTTWEKVTTALPSDSAFTARTPRLVIDGRGRFVMVWAEPTSKLDGVVPGVIRVARTETSSL